MGPRLFRRGNIARVKLNENASGWLQWGHAFSDVEILVCRHFDAQDDRASMGPRLFRRGNRVCGLLTPTRPGRFNGATPFQTWKFDIFGVAVSIRPASMGPRLFRRGNSPDLWGRESGD